jgi:lipopolysaccharide/colanic/teichoic acid biosynthesis glycosyltransferase
MHALRLPGRRSPEDFRISGPVARCAPSQRASELARVLKRGMDLVGAGVLLLLTIPLLVLAAIAIRLESPGPVLFRQERLGRDGRPFTIYKLRTMRTGNDDAAHLTYVHAMIEGRANRCGGLFKLIDDPRRTRVGRFLRTTSIDEFPQAINVLLGSMSLVGPRPATPAEAAEWPDGSSSARLAVKPGMTGLWQVRGRSRLSFDEMMALDVEYASTWTPRLDLVILLLTPLAVLRGETA